MSPRLAVAATLLLVSCAAPPGELEALGAAIVDGELSEQPGSVVAIAPQRVHCGDEPTVLCSGTLIAPDAVLSAAHCFGSMRPGLAYEVFVGASLGPDAHAVPVLEVITDPRFDPQSRQNDLAVLWLAEPVEGIQPEPLPDPSASPPVLDDRVTLAGFGATSAGTAPDGSKRLGRGRVGDVRPGVVAVDPDPSVSCVGDSGGPLFNEGSELIGVASSGDTGCSETSVYALIAPAVTGFVETVLNMGPVDRPPARDVCTGRCVEDTDCSAGFVCIPDLASNEFRCALPGQEPGTLVGACSGDSKCAQGFCATSPSASVCQCYDPCKAEPPSKPSKPSASSTGCTVRHGDGSRGLMLPLLGFLLWVRARSSR